MAAAMDRFAPGTRAGRRLPPLPGDLARSCTRSRTGSSSGSRSRICSTRSTCGPTSTPATLRDVLALRMGRRSPARSAAKVPDARVAQMLDHFTQYVGSSPDGSPAVLCGIAHMQTAEGVWYPRGGTRAVAEALAKLAGELGVDVAARHRTSTGLDIENGAVTGRRRPPTARRVACDAVVSNMDAVRTYRELVGGEAGRALRAQGFRAGLFRRRALSRPRPALRPPRATTTSSSRATRRRSSTSSTARASRRPTRPATSRRPPRPTRASRRRAARRSTCWCTRPTCGRTTTGRRCSRPTAGRSSTS